MIKKEFNPKDIIGKTFNRLTVIKCKGILSKQHHYECECICGNITIVARHNLLTSHTRSCGCYLKDILRARKKYTTEELYLRIKKQKKKSCKVYEKTKQGFVMRMYRNMKSRINGVQKKKAHLYVGKFLLDKQVFYKWIKYNAKFHLLFKEWERSGYNRKLTPTVNRINSEKGYELNNIEIITHSENSRLGAISHYNKVKGAQSIYVKVSASSVS